LLSLQMSRRENTQEPQSAAGPFGVGRPRGDVIQCWNWFSSRVWHKTPNENGRKIQSILSIIALFLWLEVACKFVDFFGHFCGGTHRSGVRRHCCRVLAAAGLSLRGVGGRRFLLHPLRIRLLHEGAELWYRDGRIDGGGGGKAGGRGRTPRSMVTEIC